MSNLLLKTTNLTKKYKNFTALDEVNMSIYEGDIYGFIGKNGAGKTTLIRTITGLIFQTSGSYDYLKKGITVSAVIEAPAIYPDLSAFENLNYAATQKNVKEPDCVNKTLDFVGLNTTGKKKVRDFSLGMRQRLSIGMAIINNPDLLILDEPINGLDPAGIIEMRKMIQRINKELKTTILISSHILSELAMVATRYGIIQDGRLVKEFSSEELATELTCKYILDVSDKEAALQLIEEKNINVVGMENNKIIFHTDNETLNIFCEKLSDRQISVYQLQHVKKELEDVFLEIVGGDYHVSVN
ncbi:ATP-binding cassette domain-containing protein [Enterococcus sp. BWB1-3]|uniref:ATP-binding cassette domain-containing protein n=1 Tax=Enterococcus sp. BWB1-3 TaxID=2787713 RepID=UPI001922955A|nr:ATP-binding cassette domain-containing protein [Enterococcus sp. BWB1-3]MBL1227831.1 ATP-binding cassette domain-containing protein [Enterococcus sp. BWB1-3]